MKGTQNRSKIIHLIVPLIALAFVIALIITDFVVRYTVAAEEAIENTFIDNTKNLATKLTDSAKMMTNIGKSFCDVLQYQTIADTNDKRATICKAIREHSGAYNVLLCDDFGVAITCQGNQIIVKNMDFYDYARTCVVDTYYYVEKDGMGGSKALVSCLPYVINENKYYLLLFYDLKNFQTLIRKSDFGEKTVYILTDIEGNIITYAGAKSNFSQGDNVFSLIDSDQENTVNVLANRMDSHGTAVAQLTALNETRTLVCCPVGVGDLVLIVGLSEAYVKKQTSNYWQDAYRIFYELILVIAIFSVTVIATNVIIKIKNKDKKKELEEKASKDLLTGLYNKHSTEQLIKAHMEKYPTQQCALILIDVDNFKKINDTMGHAFGDEVLRTLGNEIGSVFRVSDIIGRIGGDEFMIFLKDISDQEDLRKQAQKIVNFFKQFQAGSYVKYSATASMGMAVFPKEGADFESLYKAADKAVYKAKERGKAQLAFYDDTIERVK